jgi:hypothetical protein
MAFLLFGDKMKQFLKDYWLGWEEQPGIYFIAWSLGAFLVCCFTKLWLSFGMNVIIAAIIALIASFTHQMKIDKKAKESKTIKDITPKD